MEIRALGPLEVVRDGVPVKLGGTKPTMVLATLLVDVGSVVSADRLELALWGDSPPRSSSHALHVHISSLRGALPDGVAIETVDSGYRLQLSEEQYDVHRFESLVAAAIGDAPAEERAASARQALGLWRGRPFGTLADEDALRVEVQRLEQLRSDVAEARISAEIDAGRHAGVIADIEEELVGAPLREGLWRLLMLALYRSGRQAEALRAYSRLRELLGEELGIDPDPETRDLETKILLHDPSLHPPRSLTGNLPVPASSLIDRETEISTVLSMLSERRLVTIHGPPGVGKSRLALAVAAKEPGPSWYFDVSEIDDPALIVPRLAHSLGIEQRPDDLLKAVAARLDGPDTLLVLDGCETIVEAVGDLAVSLSSACPELRILVTTLVALDVPEEAIVTLRPLDPITAGVSLFVDRAAGRGLVESPGDRAVIEEICRRLEGLPLALELAASRVDVLSPQQILDRIGDRFGVLQDKSTGHGGRRTLDAAIEWSLELLPEEAVTSYATLSVFRDGFDIDAAEAMLGEDVALDHVALLARYSLLTTRRHAGVVRYRMLDAIRQHGLARLDPSALRAVRDRHAEYFRTWIRGAAKALGGPEQLEWLVHMDADHHNIRAALSHLLESGSGEAALDMGADAAWYWFLRSHLGEGWHWLERLMSETADLRTIGRVRALIAAGHFAWEQAVNDRARDWLEEALDLAEDLPSPVHRAWALAYLALLDVIDGDDASGQMRAAEAKDAFEGEGGFLGMGFATFVESLTPLLPAWRVGSPRLEEVQVGRDRLEVLAIAARSVGERNLVGHVEWALGMLATVLADHEEAATRLTAGARNLIELGNLSCLSHVLDGMAIANSAAGDHRTAARVLGMVDRLRRHTGTPGHAFERLLHARAMEDAGEAIGVGEVDSLVAEGNAMALEEILSFSWGE